MDQLVDRRYMKDVIWLGPAIKMFAKYQRASEQWRIKSKAQNSWAQLEEKYSNPQISRHFFPGYRATGAREYIEYVCKNLPFLFCKVAWFATYQLQSKRTE